MTNDERTAHDQNSDKPWQEILHDTVKTWAAEFGGIAKKTDDKSDKGNYVMRRNIPYLGKGNKASETSDNQKPYFGLIRGDQRPSGPYQDLSLVFFTPLVGKGQKENNRKDPEEKSVIVALAVGSQAPSFNEDYELAQLPSTRRVFAALCDAPLSVFMAEENKNTGVANDNNDKEGHQTELEIQSCVKSDFTNTTNAIWPLKTDDPDQHSYRGNASEYGKCCLAARYVDLRDVDGLSTTALEACPEGRLLKAFVATYAHLRAWDTNNEYRKNYRNAVARVTTRSVDNDEQERQIRQLLKERHYVVLQGAPGVGKTYTAKCIADQIATSKDAIFFTQFHAETTYSDFIYGIRPVLSEEKSSQNSVSYRGFEGPFVKAVRYARDNSDQSVVLIIDEINRANLANVLGEVFYLFEPSMAESDVMINVVPDDINSLEISKLPENFYCIATMNTADRSLAVVDFALRRRFAWYTLEPHALVFGNDDNSYFCSEIFSRFQQLFIQYATDEELDLQPGQSYFVVTKTADNDDVFDKLKNKRAQAERYKLEKQALQLRVQYELKPLIKEYLNSGLLLSARDEFDALFRDLIGQSLYR